MENRRSTIKDVARESKCSIATVSRVINGVNLYYSQETKEKVLAATKKLNYIPNLNAKGLKERCSYNIAFLVPQIDDFYVGVFDAMQEVANKKGYTVVILSSNYKQEQEKININHIIEKQYDGIIVATGFLNPRYNRELPQMFHGVPVVLLEGVGASEAIRTVNVDVEKVCRDATQYLIDLGHSRIAYVSAPCRFKTLSYRFKGYLAALRDNQIPIDGSLIFFEKGLEKTDFRKCYGIMKRVISEGDFSALLVMSDWAAFSSLKIANELGKRVPEDISIIGFDNLPFTEYSEPQLCTISQNSDSVGRSGISLIFDMLEGKETKDVCLKGNLVLRGSVAARKT